MFSEQPILAFLSNGAGEVVPHGADVDIATGINIAPNIRATIRPTCPDRVGWYTFGALRFPASLRTSAEKQLDRDNDAAGY
jgi:hypothetical protein